MQEKKSSKVSLGDVGKAAGVSRQTACYVLRNHPGPSQATREKVLRIASELGYAPDARVNSFMARVRDSKSKGTLPIGWLNTHADRDAWKKHKFLSPYLEGARERSSQLGYSLEEFWLYQPGMTMRRISQILDQRGIEGVVVTQYTTHFRLNWKHLVGVSIENTILAPRLHRVVTDTFFDFLLAIKMLNRYGYRRIGICLAEAVDRRTHHGIRALVHSPDKMFPNLKRIPPLFYSGEEGWTGWPASKKAIIAWVRRHEPEVIVGHSNLMVQCVEEAGYRVPEDIGVIHLSTDDDVSDWAGINSKRRDVGAFAAEWVISQIQNRRFGVPSTAASIAIEGVWHEGRTLLTPKPR